MPDNVATFDNHGSLWGHSTAHDTEASIATARATGADINEWQTLDRDGRPLRIVRVTDPEFLDDIHVFTA